MSKPHRKRTGYHRVIEFVETILVYKFPQKSQEEIAAMLGVSNIKQTRVYQQGEEEGIHKTKYQTALNLSKLGLHIDQIAQSVELSPEEVSRILDSISVEPSDH